MDESSQLGAQVTRFRKQSSDVFSSAAADSVRTLIENGVSVMNFFAHAYSESFDITIDDPSNYQWNGKHPFVIGNSCYIGNVHLNADGASTSEDWVMRPNAGPIAFLAATQVGDA
ncbi:MAG TPA: C25 family cysteine peptidase, partial [Flavobacteriales bacterium]|nr:C25 family cysteine peptidase [Flavobacteriales bacterium]